MKKKILLLSALMMLFVSAASGSSINGDYKGNPIVNINVNGIPAYSSVPAINFDGSTLVPLRTVAESLGAEVVWNEKTFTASINSKNQIKTSGINDIKSFITTAKQYIKKDGLSVDNYQVIVDESQLYVHTTLAIDNMSPDVLNSSLSNIAGLPLLSKEEINATVITTTISGAETGAATIYMKDVNDYIDKKISFQQFLKTWEFVSYQEQLSTGITSNTSNKAAVCAKINNVYDEAIRKVNETMNERGILNSSMTKNEVTGLNQRRTTELKDNGC